MTRIQLIYANYGCADEIQRSIGSIAHAGASVYLDIVVVENGGDRLERSKVELPGGCALRILSPGKNVGYFGALTEAITAPLDESGYDFRILCNPDVKFEDPSFFSRLASLSLEKSVAILAPTITSGISGTDQNPYLTSRPSAGLLRRWRLMYYSWASYALYQLLSNARLRILGVSSVRSTLPAEQVKIYAPHGAFIIFANQFLEEARDLERIPFLFAEELFLGEICHRSNRIVLYRPDLRVRHIEHATTTRIGTFRKFRMHKDALGSFLAYINSA